MTIPDPSQIEFPPVGTPEFWELYMQLYDDGVATTFPYWELMRELVAQIMDGRGRKLRVLDLGCGTGHLLSVLQFENPVNVLVGIDRSPAAIDRALRRVFPVAGRLEVTLYDADLNGDWTRRPRRMEAGSFDVIISSNVLYALRNPPLLLRYAHGLLRPGGRLVLSTPHLRDFRPLIAAQRERIDRGNPSSREVAWDKLHRETLPRIIKANQMILAASCEDVHHFIQPDDLETMVKQAGFCAVSYRNVRSYAGTNTTLTAIR